MGRVPHNKILRKLSCTPVPTRINMLFSWFILNTSLVVKSATLLLDKRDVKWETRAINHFTNLNPKYKLNIK